MTIIPFIPHFIFLLVALLSSTHESTALITPQQLSKGFTVTPDPTATDFQPILTDSTRNFSLNFLRVNQDQLALAIVHVPSGVPLWQAGRPGMLARWGKPTRLIFNGSLVITDSKSGVFWSTNTDGDKVVLSSDPNLQILKGEKARNSVWQSFEFPSDTLVQNQNYTSAMSLVSSNGLYTMRLGPDFIGLYAKFNPEGSGSGPGPDQIYFKHGALQAKASVVPGQGPILVRISSDGFLGMYQKGSVPVDVQPFNSYQRTVPGPRRLRLESDGNLKAYFWSGSRWAPDYQFISETCELPSPCGPYGLCTPGVGCSCLDNRTYTGSVGCNPTRNKPENLCEKKGSKYKVLRRTGVELPFKELMISTETASYEECEKSCELNCTCWGALYNNGSGKCYSVEYPIETIVGMGGESKMGYFKVWEGVGKRMDVGLGVGIGLLSGAIIVISVVVGYGGYKIWKRKSRAVNNININRVFLEEENVASGPYKDLASTSFGSIELNNK